MPKRKCERVADHTTKTTQSQPTCIVHVTTISDHGCFTPLSQVRGTARDKLQQICEIRDRHLLQSSDSPYRVQSICDQITTTLPADLENTGYHRQCYQRFTGNLIRLEDGTSPVPPTTPQRRQSTRTSSSPGSKRNIFAPDCIFCEKLETKCGDRKTERAERVLFLDKQGECVAANRTTGFEDWSTPSSQISERRRPFRCGGQTPSFLF